MATTKTKIATEMKKYLKSIGTATLLDDYRMMLLIRRFEEKAGQLYTQGMIGGFCHLYIGQEAVAVGIASVLRDTDSIITGYRDHGLMLACNSDPMPIMAELCGRITGCSKGKGGSMHMFDLEKKFYGGHGIVGSQISLGTGIAFANKYNEVDDICVSFVGDGGINQGQVYESFNMATLWNLPALYIVENNHYAMGTSVQRSTVATELFKRGEIFGIEGIKLNGMDYIEVRSAMEYIIPKVRAGSPILVEMDTYRYRGHSMSDPAKYRTRDEVDHYRKNSDPIDMLRNILVEYKIESEENLKVIDTEIKSYVKSIEKEVLAAPEPDASELYTDVYIDF